jgi:hypothetical protein
MRGQIAILPHPRNAKAALQESCVKVIRKWPAARADLSGHPNPANDGHLKTGQ